MDFGDLIGWRGGMFIISYEWPKKMMMVVELIRANQGVH